MELIKYNGINILQGNSLSKQIRREKIGICVTTLSKSAWREASSSEEGVKCLAISFLVIASIAKQSSHPCHCTLVQKRHAVLDTASQKQETFACTRLDCHATNVARSDAIFTVMLNLFQHLTSLACNLFNDKILKRVQDDNLTKEGLLCFP